MRRQRRKPRTRPVGRLDSTRPVRDAVRVAERDLKRLADAVIAARSGLRMSRDEFAAKGKLGPKTVQRIERCEIANPRGATLTGLDLAAGWPDGTARKIWELDLEPPPTQSEATREPDVTEQPAEVKPDARPPTDAGPGIAAGESDSKARQQLIEMSYDELGHVAELIEAAEGIGAAEAFMRNALRVRAEARGLGQMADGDQLQTDGERSAG